MPTTSATLFPGQQALWSADRAYRSFLRRPVDDKAELAAKPPIAFILLNPSTADEVQDDRTVARARRFAAAWGCGEVIIPTPLLSGQPTRSCYASRPTRRR